MNLVKNIMLSTAGVAGIGTAVGVPIGMSYSKNGDSFISKISLNMCDPKKLGELREINYGNNLTKKICWDGVKGSGDKSSLNIDQFTRLFDVNGEHAAKPLRGDPEYGGTSHCLNNNAKEEWVLKNTQTEESPEYIGLCGEYTVDNTKFLKKQKEKRDEVQNQYGSFGTCDKNCGEYNKENSVAKELNKEKSENWKEVKFYSSEVENIKSST